LNYAQANAFNQKTLTIGISETTPITEQARDTPKSAQMTRTDDRQTADAITPTRPVSMIIWLLRYRAQGGK
jgi:hypothetical protein